MDARTADGRKQRRVWGERDAREALTELSRSGETIAQFARRHGFSEQRVYYWKKRLDAHRAPAFVAVPVTEARSGHIEIVADGVTLRIREDVDAERLAEIVEALGRRRAC